MYVLLISKAWYTQFSLKILTFGDVARRYDSTKKAGDQLDLQRPNGDVAGRSVSDLAGAIIREKRLFECTFLNGAFIWERLLFEKRR